MDHITELFCLLDDFCKIFDESLEKSLIAHQNQMPQKSAFPKLLSYNRFVEIMPRCLQALSCSFIKLKEPIQELVSLIQPSSLFVIILELNDTVYLKTLRIEGKVVLDGFMDSNYTL